MEVIRPPIHTQRRETSSNYADCTRDVLPTVLSKCHAQTGCSMSVSPRLLGNPCPKQVSPYLNILFMCGTFRECRRTPFSLGNPLPPSQLGSELQNCVLSNISSNRGDKSHNFSAVFPQLFITTQDKIKITSKEIFSEEAIKGELPSLEKYIKVCLLIKIQIITMGGFYQKGCIAIEIFANQDLQDGSGDGPEENDEQEDQWVAREHGPMFNNDGRYGVLLFKLIRRNVVCLVLSVSLALILLLVACIVQQFCGGSKKDERVRYSIERSQLIAKSNPCKCEAQSHRETNNELLIEEKKNTVYRNVFSRKCQGSCLTSFAPTNNLLDGLSSPHRSSVSQTLNLFSLSLLSSHFFASPVFRSLSTVFS
uniref:SUEL-type lectin domain-containing protein n=1 Tax=Heterorhabditis bacteriophora TaxID=37862 RepID=A0A1I7WEJ3_HETBA